MTATFGGENCCFPERLLDAMSSMVKRSARFALLILLEVALTNDRVVVSPVFFVSSCQMGVLTGSALARWPKVFSYGLGRLETPTATV